MSVTMKNNRLMSVDDALGCFLPNIEPVRRTVVLPIEKADGRVLSKDVIAPIDYPHYDQCILDGYAVRAEDTTDCGNKHTRYLSITDNDSITEGLCVAAHTGSALASGADALLRIEDARAKGTRIIPTKEVVKGQWIWAKGDGLSRGEIVYREGMHLKPTDIAMLAKLGIGKVSVYDEPRVLIIPTGAECVKRGDTLEAGFVYEANGLMCSLLVKRYGGNPTIHDIVPDNKEELHDALLRGIDYDLVVTIGGSSSGKRDFMAQVMASAGVLVFHGVALHPGNHMGAGIIEGGNRSTPVLFLPGCTESCTVATFTFVDPAIKKLGHSPPSHHPTETCILAERVVTTKGIQAVRKLHIQEGKAKPVKLIGDSAQPGDYAYLTVPEDLAGLEAGTMVEAVYFE